MFSYYMPTKLFFGEGCLRQHKESLVPFGENALIVTGASSAKKSGALDDIEEVLQELQINYSIYSGIKENPTIESIVAGTAQFRENSCQMVIGIGGGSPVDAAKAISVMAANNLTSEDIYSPAKIKKAFPIVAITTTSGTGTEATPYSVITSGSKKAGFGTPLMFPQVSFLDPSYTVSMPLTVTRDTAIDALSHLLEGLYSAKRCPLLYPFIFSGVRLIYSTLALVLANPENREYRKQLMIASLYGGMVIAQTSTTLQHSIGYPLTTELGMSHGFANGIVMKQIMELYYPAVKQQLDLLFEHLGCSRNDFYDWLAALGISTKLNLTDRFIEDAAEQIYHSRNMALNPIIVEKDKIKDLLKKL